MSDYNFEELVDVLYSDEKNILILDTCILLDIVRAPIRESLASLAASIEIADNLSDSNYNIVIPSFVPNEWMDNISSVCDEVNNSISKSQKGIAYLAEIIHTLGSEKPVIHDFLSLKLEVVLRTLSKKILDHGMVLKSLDRFRLNALDRVANKIPPSKQGKESIKDCVIYEEALGLGNELRRLGFDKTIVFSSSNTREYDNEYINDELSSFNIQYCNNLNWALHIIK